MELFLLPGEKLKYLRTFSAMPMRQAIQSILQKLDTKSFDLEGILSTIPKNCALKLALSPS